MNLTRGIPLKVHSAVVRRPRTRYARSFSPCSTLFSTLRLNRSFVYRTDPSINSGQMGGVFFVSVQASDKSASNSPVKSSAPAAPARMALAFPDEPARGRLSVQTYKAKRSKVRPAVRLKRRYGSSGGTEYKQVLLDELGAVVTNHRYPTKR